MNKNIITHYCTVEPQTSGSYLLPLKKKSSYLERFIRVYKKFIQVSEKDPLTQEYFRSTTGFLNERERHALSEYTYIIHPFSDFSHYRELIMIFSLASTFICAPLITLFPEMCSVSWIYVLEILTTIVFCIAILVNFFRGIDDKEHKEVILVHRIIVRKYVLSVEFLLDILTAFSFCSLSYVLDIERYHYLSFLRMLKIFKLKSFLRHVAHAAQRWNFSTVGTVLMRYSLMTTVLIHWSTCFFHHACSEHQDSGLIHYVYGNTLTSIYFSRLFDTMSLLLCADSSWDMSCSLKEIITFIIINAIGNIYLFVLTVCTVNQVLNKWSLQTEYMSMTDQLKEFMKYKKLPMTLRQKIEHYFDYKFRNKYFQENLITSVLSDKLKREINFQVCKSLVQHAAFLSDLPTKALGDVLNHLKSEVFLPNDIILRAGAPGDCMYFLSSGTVLVTTPSGKEVCHLQDGAYFGEIAMLSKDTKRTANVIALEICETFKLDKKFFKMSIKKYPDCLKIVQALAETRLQQTNQLEETYKEELFQKTYIGDK